MGFFFKYSGSLLNADTGKRSSIKLNELFVKPVCGPTIRNVQINFRYDVNECGIWH